MKIRSLLLLILVGYDFSLHLVEILNKVNLHPLYPNFPLFGIISYDIFWTVYFGIATFLALTLLGSGTTIKNKTEVHIHQDDIKGKEDLDENKKTQT